MFTTYLVLLVATLLSLTSSTAAFQLFPPLTKAKTASVPQIINATTASILLADQSSSCPASVTLSEPSRYSSPGQLPLTIDGPPKVPVDKGNIPGSPQYTTYVPLTIGGPPYGGPANKEAPLNLHPRVSAVPLTIGGPLPVDSGEEVVDVVETPLWIPPTTSSPPLDITDFDLEDIPLGEGVVSNKTEPIHRAPRTLLGSDPTGDWLLDYHNLVEDCQWVHLWHATIAGVVPRGSSPDPTADRCE